NSYNKVGKRVLFCFNVAKTSVSRCCYSCLCWSS
uniref:Uncharacterized protein n=1 Tax=Taeniopygia guttata TaxID=59729 RepID=A0A674GNC8_TAEGU